MVDLVLGRWILFPGFRTHTDIFSCMDICVLSMILRQHGLFVHYRCQLRKRN